MGGEGGGACIVMMLIWFTVAVTMMKIFMVVK